MTVIHVAVSITHLQTGNFCYYYSIRIKSVFCIVYYKVYIHDHHLKIFLSRFSHSANLLGCKTLQTTFASNSDPLRSEKPMQGKASGTSSSNETERTPPQGPPFLTIVAGALVFFLVCWVVGSLVIWAVSHIVNILTSK
ncbi:hypothetical protein QQ045_018126 [Rhodiola kirilowii]